MKKGGALQERIIKECADYGGVVIPRPHAPQVGKAAGGAVCAARGFCVSSGRGTKGAFTVTALPGMVKVFVLPPRAVSLTSFPRLPVTVAFAVSPALVLLA